MTPILSTIYSTFKSSTTPNIISSINTKMSSTIHQCDEMSYIYETTLQKFNNYHEREKSLRKFVLLQDDIKKEEETWLDACLDNASLDEYDDGYVYVIKPNDGDQQIIGEVGGVVVAGEKEEKEPIINYRDEIIIPNDLFLEESKINSNINSKIGNNNIISNNNNISDQEFHPYWKDNSHAILDLLQSDNQPYFFDQSTNTTNNTNRSQDDLDMLFYSPPKDLLDHGMLSDIISMLEWYGGKKNDSSNNNGNNNDPNNKNTTTTATECVNTSINANNWFVECEKC
ncbi:22687_t:CDS:2 [Entrophospora sp. SA101]|nr:18780_t:CDS:2 [Entrophospora sp. SA101]CAJ0767607.1 22687_t:CDS:2 [Entrophospora sp. SA101]